MYNPDRWFRNNGEKKGPSVGVYGNLYVCIGSFVPRFPDSWFRLAFAGGVRACIGWRFALCELQALTVEIINSFELGLTPDIERLRREACLVMIPTLEGEELKGENLPLKVTLAPRD